MSLKIGKRVGNSVEFDFVVSPPPDSYCAKQKLSRKEVKAGDTAIPAFFVDTKGK